MSQVERAPLDRIEMAITLRKAGVDVDFEDWDGLEDRQIIPLIRWMHPEVVKIEQITPGEKYEV